MEARRFEDLKAIDAGETFGFCWAFYDLVMVGPLKEAASARWRRRGGFLVDFFFPRSLPMSCPVARNLVCGARCGKSWFLASVRYRSRRRTAAGRCFRVREDREKEGVMGDVAEG